MKDIEGMKIETMSSQEIAELLNKKHFHVLRDIEKIKSHFGDQSRIGFIERINNLGSTSKDKVWFLNKRDSLLVVSGYSVELRAKIIDRWEQLEEVVKDLDVISKVKAIALTGDFNAATKAVSDLCNDSEQIGKVGSKLMTERKKQKREAKKLTEEVSARFQLDLF